MKQLAFVVPVTIAILCAACGTSDETVATNVRTRLAAAATLDTSQVTVQAKNQVVTLSGSVATAAAKEEAVQVARQADGVRDVVDELQVSQAAAATSAPSSAGPSGAAGERCIRRTAAPAASDARVGQRGHPCGRRDRRRGHRSRRRPQATAVVDGAKVAGDATVKGTKVAADATVDGAKAAGNATVKGAEATASGAKKLGSGIAGAVTPDKK